MFIETAIHHVDGSETPLVISAKERPYGLLIRGESRDLILPPGARVHFDFDSEMADAHVCAELLNPYCPNCGRIHL